MNDPLRGPLESRLLAVERTLTGMESDLRRLDRDAIALWQEIWDEGSTIKRRGTTPAVSALFSGTLRGCSGLPLSGISVVAKDHGSGSTVGTFTTDGSGGFSGSVSVAEGAQVDFSTTGVYRFDDGSISANLTMTGSTVVGTLTLTPSAGYACLSGCAYPVATTLTATDALSGVSATMAYNSGTHLWVGCSTIGLPGYTHVDTCAAVTSALRWTLDGATGALSNNFQLNGTGANVCAVANTCASTLTNSIVATLWSQSKTCPGPSATFGISATTAFVNVSQFYRGTIPAVTIVE